MRNKYLLILFLLTGILGFSQQYNYVQVDNTYTPDRLVNDVFVKSSCDLVSNVRYQNGDGSPQTLQYYTLGYFEKNGSTFPFDDGIVLCTNESQYIPGPFTGSSFDFHGSNNFRWGGDKDLNDAITAGGGAPLAQYRSTQLQFDFIPVQKTVSFEYLFASHSYDNSCTYVCQNGAMFAAWLIDTTTGVGQNLALVPNTTDPISINTVRDVTKSGAGCASANAQYFANYYGAGANQTPPLSAAINYIGHTTEMQSLTANVIIGRKYTIKLAVIDFCPTMAHSSAAFFKAGSFDIGNLNLGDPVLIGEGNGLCVGDSYTLQSGLDPNLFTFEWYQDGVLMPGQTGASLTVTQTADYSVKGFIPNVSGCIMESDPVRVEFYDYVNISAPQNLEACPNAGATTRFDLKDAVVGVTTNPNILFSFYRSKQDADNDTNAIPDLYTLQILRWFL